MDNNSAQTAKWIDNIGNVLTVGDFVLCLTGQNAYTFATVKSLTSRHNYYEPITPTATLNNGSTVSDYNVISLTALGIGANDVSEECRGTVGYDTLGKQISIGDKVLYLHSKEMRVAIGTVQKLCPKLCALEITENRFGQTEYKAKYGEILSLSAIGKEHIKISEE
ncbi:hypothetical protein EOM82_04475 [bacterium]|nr:hypothetical protein [bacterium]